jgi:capsular exopolysaccharide synthesis family protein
LDNRNRRGRPKPLARTDIIDEVDQGSAPDVEVFQLEGVEPERRAAKPQKKRWLDEVKTTVWQGEDPPSQQQQRPSQQQPLRDPPVRYGARYHPRDPYARRQPKLIEAPAQIKVQSVARISPDPRLWLMTHPESDQAEQYRVMVLRLREEHGARVVAVTSPTRKGEGQLAAVNVALAFAEGGRSRTVLIDADLRGSEIGALLDLHQPPSIADQIRQHRRAPESDWITFGLSSSLHYVPAGPPERNPASLLSSEVMSQLMGEIRRYFDFVVLSTPPVMDSADVNILQEHVDGVVLVVRAGITRRDSVTSSINRLGVSRFLGTVLVGARRR